MNLKVQLIRKVGDEGCSQTESFCFPRLLGRELGVRHLNGPCEPGHASSEHEGLKAGSTAPSVQTT